MLKYLVGRFKIESCNEAVAAERSHEQWGSDRNAREYLSRQGPRPG